MSSQIGIWSTLFQMWRRTKKSPSSTVGRPSIERARREQLEQLDDAAIAERHALRADLEDQALVAGQELLRELQMLRQPRLEQANLGQRHQRPRRALDRPLAAAPVARGPRSRRASRAR